MMRMAMLNSQNRKNNNNNNRNDSEYRGNQIGFKYHDGDDRYGNAYPEYDRRAEYDNRYIEPDRRMETEPIWENRRRRNDNG